MKTDSLKKNVKSTALCGALCGAMSLVAGAGQATEGYFALGYGTVQRGQAGAGAADVSDAMSVTVNPAAVATVGRELSMGVEVFSPRRGIDGDGTVFVRPGETRSRQDIFLVPNFAYNLPVGDGVINFAAYGNGGMNTNYGAVANPNCGPFTGVFCGGEAGVDLTQLFVSVGYARKDGPLSWGVAPTFAVQRFAAKGLGMFTGFSVDGAHMTDKGYDFSSGVGLRAGVQLDLSPQLTFGLSGQTRFNMSKLDAYAGLFEDGGSFDIPASITAGLALKANDRLTLLADVQRIYYSKIGAIGNATDAGAFGAKGGAGFGWDDVDVVRIGAQWKQSDDMTWRFGYAHATNPVGPEDVMLNILAPGIVEHHFTVGGTRRLNDRDSLDFSVAYVPSNTVTGPEVAGGFPTGRNIELEMHQFSVSVGWTRRF